MDRAAVLAEDTGAAVPEAASKATRAMILLKCILLSFRTAECVLKVWIVVFLGLKT